MYLKRSLLSHRNMIYGAKGMRKVRIDFRQTKLTYLFQKSTSKLNKLFVIQTYKDRFAPKNFLVNVNPIKERFAYF